MRGIFRSLLALPLAFLIVPGASLAQDQQPPKQTPSSSVTITPRSRGRGADPSTITDRPANLRVDTTLVLIPVGITDPLGRFVTGLDQENFKVLENNVEQVISQFSSEDAPLSVGIVFDTSGSMGSKLQRSREAVKQFLKTANPEDEFFLIEFNDRPEIVTPFTADTEVILSKLMFTQPKGRTALLDGLYLAMNQMKKAHNARKAILLISDGGDNSSRYTETEVRKLVREADVQIYGIGIYESMAARSRTSEELSGPALLAEVSEQTGGRNFDVGNLAELPDVAAKIGIELRNQYVLGYRPKNTARDGKYRRVQVRLVKTTNLPQLKATFRTGYYAPAQ